MLDKLRITFVSQTIYFKNVLIFKITIGKTSFKNKSDLYSFYNTLLFRLATEEEVRQAKAKAEAMEQENAELTGLLSKKEQELEQHIQEKVKFFT